MMGDCGSGSCSTGSCSSCSSGSDDDRLPPGMLAQYDLDKDTGLGVLMWIDIDDGRISEGSVRLLGRIRKESEDRIFAMISGPPSIRPIYDTLFEYGVDNLYHIRCRELETYEPLGLSLALADLAERLNPMCILVPSDGRGNDVAEKTAMKMGRQLHRDCTSFSIRNNILTFECPSDLSLPMIGRRNVHPVIATIRDDPSFIPERTEGRKGSAFNRPFRM